MRRGKEGGGGHAHTQWQQRLKASNHIDLLPTWLTPCTPFFRQRARALTPKFTCMHHCCRRHIPPFPPHKFKLRPPNFVQKKPTPSKTRGFLATGPINRPLRLKWLWMFWQCRVLKKYIIVPPGHFSSRELPEFSPCEQLLLGKQKSIYHVCNFCFHKQTHKKSSMHWAPQSGCDTPGTDTPRGSPSQGLWRSLAGKIPKLKETTTT